MARMGRGEFFGEMAIFEKQHRNATIRALGEVRVLSGRDITPEAAAQALRECR